jgi:hypothetical protein
MPGTCNSCHKSWTCWFGPSLCKSTGYSLIINVDFLYSIYLFLLTDRKCFGMSQTKESQLDRLLSMSTSRISRLHNDLLCYRHCVGICMSWVARFIPFMNAATCSLPLALHFCHPAGYSESGVFWDVFGNVKNRLPPCLYISQVNIRIFYMSIVNCFYFSEWVGFW